MSIRRFFAAAVGLALTAIPGAKAAKRETQPEVSEVAKPVQKTGKPWSRSKSKKVARQYRGRK